MQKQDKLNKFDKVMLLVAFLITFLICGACFGFWYIQCLNRHPTDMIGMVCGPIGSTDANPRWLAGTREAEYDMGIMLGGTATAKAALDPNHTPGPDVLATVVAHLTQTAEATD